MTPLTAPAELEQYQRALQASEHRFRLLIEKNADGVVVVGQDGVIRYANPAAEALLRRSVRQLVGEMFGIPIVPGETTDLDIPQANKTCRVVEMRVVEIDFEGEPAFLASLRDITERRRASEALRFLDQASTLLAGSLDYRRTLQNVARLAVMHLADWCFIDLLEDQAGQPCLHRIVTAHCDPAREALAAQLCGRYALDREAVIGLPKVLRSGRPKVRLDIIDEFLQTLAPSENQRRVLDCLGCKAVMIVPLKARDRTLGAISFVASVLTRRYDAASLALAEDLALRAALALDNARLYDLSQEAVRRRDEFLAMLSHELRNPLAAMLHASRRITAEGVAGPNARDVIERQGRQMARLLDDLLDISRVTHGKIELQKTRLDLSAVVMDVIQAHRAVLESRDHSLSVSLPEEPMWLHADLTRLEQVVSNLLHNAVKYTNVGGRLEVILVRDGSTAVLSVRDNGVGIPAEMLSSIFDLFTQVDAPLDRTAGGLGIGLTLVRQLVEMHGGTVQALSAGVGQGSEFVVRLPALETEEPVIMPCQSEPLDRQHCRVLLVEDHVDSRTMLRELIEMWGHEVHEAVDGLQGLSLTKSWRPDIALIDIGLPGLNGYELVRRLREEINPPRPCFVALTGYGRPEDRRQALEAGFDAHLVKPVDLNELEKLLSQRQPFVEH